MKTQLVAGLSLLALTMTLIPNAAAVPPIVAGLTDCDDANPVQVGCTWQCELDDGCYCHVHDDDGTHAVPCPVECTVFAVETCIVRDDAPEDAMEAVQYVASDPVGFAIMVIQNIV